VAAKVDIPAGAELTENMLQLREVPPQFIPQQAITNPEERRQLIGRTTRVPLGRNQIVLWSDFEVEKRGGLSSLIPVAERAFTVEIAAGVKSELLQLNDRVDILGIFDLPNPDSRPGVVSAPATVCVVLLQNVTVIAVGETIGQVMSQPQQFGRGGQITFSVTLPEAQMLMFSSQYGELALALRREGEIEIVARQDLPRVTFEELEKITSDLDNVRKNRIIQIMKGRETEEIRIETGPAASGE
jgi:Flp pilus assembly protein CpaB